MTIKIPETCLVLLIGTTGSGKSTFARRHFLPTEILSSDAMRGLVSDDENDQSVTASAFALLGHIARVRLSHRRLTVIDATNLYPEDRATLLAIAKAENWLSIGIVLDLPEKICQTRNEARGDRNFGSHVLRRQRSALRATLKGGTGALRREGFHRIHVLDSEDAIEAVTIEREPMWCDRRTERGPFDIIGDVHGCYDELLDLLRSLGYEVQDNPEAPPGEVLLTAPRDAKGQPRRLIFLGDLVDRGPASPAVLRLVRRAVQEGKAFCVPGNHDDKLLRKLKGANVRIAHGLEATLEQLEQEPAEFEEEIRIFLESLVSHLVLDEGRLVVAHAGLKEELQGRSSGVVRSFCLYGETTGESDEFGLPIRYEWAKDYRGKAMVVYGHTPTPNPEWLNRTICIDTGCVFGGKLTALRYPERELCSVPAHRTYVEPKRPIDFHPSTESVQTAQQVDDQLLDLKDLMGKRHIETRFGRRLRIAPEGSAAALELLSRFAVDPRWLITLPPTMAPSSTSDLDGTLEHPACAFADYRKLEVKEVLCEEKHMGSRAVLIIGESPKAIRARFGIDTGELGIVLSRTGRRFFSDQTLERGFLERLSKAAQAAGLFEELKTDWLCLDSEILPWSAKAKALLIQQYAPVGRAARESLAAATSSFEALAQRLDQEETHHLLAQMRAREDKAERYVTAYRRYCSEVRNLDDYRCAPFHLLASEGAVHHQRDHAWHLEHLRGLADHDPLFLATAHVRVQLQDEESCAAGIQFFDEVTRRGGEGIVVKPLSFLSQAQGRWIQPALKVRGREYLRVIYGPEYDHPDHLARLRLRGLQRKRSLALREFLIGLEALERFVAREPLRRVHECVFAIAALECEPVDPRL